jgi:hypothetical protein
MLFSTIGLIFGTVVGVWFGTKLNEAPRWLSWAYTFWIFGLLWGWLQHLFIPFEIQIREDGSISFRGIFKVTVVPATDIVSIRAWGNVLGGSMLRIKHRRGSLKIMYNMAGLADFVGNVRRLNPAVDVKGSWLNPLL